MKAIPKYRIYNHLMGDSGHWAWVVGLKIHGDHNPAPPIDIESANLLVSAAALADENRRLHEALERILPFAENDAASNGTYPDMDEDIIFARSVLKTSNLRKSK